MTFDSEITTNYGGIIRELGNRLTTVTGWSLIQDDTTAAGDDQNQYIVVKNPWGEYIRIYIESRRFTFEYGPDWDETNDVWNELYPQSLRDDRGYIVPYTSSSRPSLSDDVLCWFEYVPRGFVMYVERMQADGNDGDMFMGFAKVEKTWDFRTADKQESRCAYSYWGSRGDGWGDGSPNNTNPRRWNRMGVGGETGDTFDGYGIINPDADWNNYPMAPTIQASTRFRNTSNVDTPIGTHDLWLHDRSGTNSAHKDTIQDDAGNNVYTILKGYDVELAMRMD